MVHNNIDIHIYIYMYMYQEYQVRNKCSDEFIYRLSINKQHFCIFYLYFEHKHSLFLQQNYIYIYHAQRQCVFLNNQ